MSQRQYEIARKILKPIETKKVEAEEKKVEVKPIEEAVQPKAKKTRKLIGAMLKASLIAFALIIWLLIMFNLGGCTDKEMPVPKQTESTRNLSRDWDEWSAFYANVRNASPDVKTINLPK